MRFEYAARNLEITASLELYTERSFAFLKKLLKGIPSDFDVLLRVELSRTTAHHHKGEVFMVKGTLKIPKKTFELSSSATTIRAALDMLKDTLRHAVQDYKDKQATGRRRGL